MDEPNIYSEFTISANELFCSVERVNEPSELIFGASLIIRIFIFFGYDWDVGVEAG
jgi:hypothetical protein